MSRWQAICDLLKYAIGERDRTPRLLMIITVLVVAIIVLLVAVVVLAGPHAHAELVRGLWRVIHVIGRYPPLG